MSTKDGQSIDRLPDAELDIMLVLWSVKEPMKTAKILKLLNTHKNWSISTLQALLARLENRGFVEVVKQMRFKYYVPLIEEEDYRSKETKTFLERFHGNSFKSLVTTLINDKTIAVSDLDEIADMIREAGDKNG